MSFKFISHVVCSPTTWCFDRNCCSYRFVPLCLCGIDHDWWLEPSGFLASLKVSGFCCTSVFFYGYSLMCGKLWRWMTLTDSSIIHWLWQIMSHRCWHFGTMQQHQWGYHWEWIHFICEMVTRGMTDHVSTRICLEERSNRPLTLGRSGRISKGFELGWHDWKGAAPILREIGCSSRLLSWRLSKWIVTEYRSPPFFVCRCRIRRNLLERSHFHICEVVFSKQRCCCIIFSR